MKGFSRFESGLFQQNPGNMFPVQTGKLLTENHIMQVLFQVFPRNIAKIIRYLFLMIPAFDFLYRLLNFFLPASHLIFPYNPVNLFRLRFLLALQFNRYLLIDICHLFTKITAACMNNKVMPSIVSLIHFNKMIASAQGSDAACNSG